MRGLAADGLACESRHLSRPCLHAHVGTGLAGHECEEVSEEAGGDCGRGRGIGLSTVRDRQCACDVEKACCSKLEAASRHVDIDAACAG